MYISEKKSTIPLASIRGTRRDRNKQFYIHEHEGEGDKSLEIDDGFMSVVPNDTTRTVVYTFGASGSGKSTWISNFLDEFVRKNKKAELFYISRLTDDDAFSDFNVKRLKIDESLLDEPITCDDFPEGSFLIFDDIDSIQPKKLNDAVQGILRDVLETGRHRNLTVCVSSHLGSDYKRTRTILNESHLIVCFPHGSSAQQIRYVLKTYGGLSNEDTTKVLHLPSRWVCLRRQYPPAIIHQNGAYLLCDTKK